ncbi:MAG: hypothetical protein WCJ45_00920 [bacterium]
MKINLIKKKQHMYNLSVQVFNDITLLRREMAPAEGDEENGYPENVRSKDLRPPNVLPKDILSQGTGMCVNLRTLFKRDVMNFHIGMPSTLAKFYVDEKTVRTEMLGHRTSQESEDIDHNRFAGCVTYFIDDQEIHAAVAGLKNSNEDAAVAVILLAQAVDVPIDEIIDDIQSNGGQLPKEIFQKGHYLYELVEKYRPA